MADAQRPTVDIYHADSREVLAMLADNSVDAVVCDPPYALVSIQKRFGKAGSAPPSSEGASGVYMRSASGFMGQDWDTGETAFAVEFWAQVWRVLKPGGHVVAFSATRTYHRLAVAIEDAGFEIRDMIADLIATDAYVEAFAESLDAGQRSLFARMLHESPFGGMLAWIYGSGFPKSHDIARGVDAMDRTEAARERALSFTGWMRASGLTSAEINAITGTNMGGHYLTSAAQPAVATAEYFDLLRPHLPPVPEWVETLVAERTVESENLKRRKVVGAHDAPAQAALWRAEYQGGAAAPAGLITEPLTEAAQAWQGWGTALKPAIEPVCVARKPLDGTLAENAVKWGVGGFNIDACRIDADDDDDDDEDDDDAKGRWPANVIHDGSAEVVAGFPSEAGAFAPVKGTEPSAPATNVYGEFGRSASVHHGDSGSAARFFYSAKADQLDRMGSDHPTVKPVDVMAWLIRLVCPPGGLVLDPFAGSGTTGVAAVREGRRAILIERDAKHAATCRRRVAWAQGQGGLTAQEALKPKIRENAAALSGAGTPLFGGGDE